MQNKIEVFESKFTPEPNSGCWLWMESDCGMGYGTFHWRGGRTKAHRVSYEMYVGHVPNGIHVLHRCDNPACVNPEHLFLGTHQDNMTDKKEKGRASRMSRDEHPMTKLPTVLCLEIQQKYTGEYGQIKSLALEYRVDRNTITQALKVKEEANGS